jgi:hypothetical protein
MSLNRRNFVKKGLLASAAISATPFLSNARTIYPQSTGSLEIKAYPHEWMGQPTWVYLADENVDPFKSSVRFNLDSVVIDDPTELLGKRFSINAIWFIEGFGNVVLDATNGGKLYAVDDFPKNSNLNYEFAKSRVVRNREIKKHYEKMGTRFSREIEHLTALGEELYEEAGRRLSDGAKSGEIELKVYQDEIFETISK